MCKSDVCSLAIRKNRNKKVPKREEMCQNGPKGAQLDNYFLFMQALRRDTAQELTLKKDEYLPFLTNPR